MGLPEDIATVELDPIEIDFNNNRIKQIVTDEFWTFFLSYEGSVFVCGRNIGFSGLYLDINLSVIYTPQQITPPSIIVHKMVGSDGSVMFLAQDDNMFSYGVNFYGELGVGNSLSIIGAASWVSFFAMNNEKVQEMFLVKHNSIFVTDKKRIYISGRSSQRERPVCIYETTSNSEIDVTKIKKVVDGDGYGNVLLFHTEDFEVYRYHYRDEDNVHIVEKVLSCVIDIDSSGRDLSFITST